MIGQLNTQAKSIILIGSFNPEIYQPAWLLKQGLIKEQESNNANIQIIHKDVCLYSLEWCNLEITRERFSISATEERYYETIRDLIVGIFTILSHTPINKMGLNSEMHYELRNKEDWHLVGNTLAPKEIWNKIFEKPAMRSLTIEDSLRPDKLQGYYWVKVEPSVKINNGIYFLINDHYELPTEEKIGSVEYFIDILQHRWSDSNQKAKEIVNKILENI